MESQLKRKVSVKLQLNGRSPSNSSSRNAFSNISRPPSPLKSYITVQSPPVVTRPKAKVISSAAARSTSSAVSRASSNGAKSSTSTTPRPRSPFKHPPVQSRSRPPSPMSNAQATTMIRATVPPATAHSTPSTPERQHYPFSTVSPDDTLVHKEKSRSGSISLHHTVSFSSLHSRTPSASSTAPSSARSMFIRDGNAMSQAGITPGRVKAKVSAMAQQVESANPLSLSPKMRSIQPRVRAPSISSSVSLNGAPSLSPNPIFYPITTATAAANPHRFAPTRSSPPTTGRYHYQPFSPNDDLHINRSKKFVVPNVDPAIIPLPLHSPPDSTVSFSSQSSVSQSSPSYQTENSEDSQSSLKRFSSPACQPKEFKDTDISNREELATREVIPKFRGRGQIETDEEQSSEDGKVKAEAKSNRKIADLEITNRSLLAINTSLETVKHRQAKEIRELRRKLRESRLILPPRAFRAVTSSTNRDDTDEDGEESGEELGGRTGDEAYERIKVMLEGLIDTGMRALESRKEDFQEGAGTKVLSAEEVRTWRGSIGNDAAGYEALANGRGYMDFGNGNTNGFEGLGSVSHVDAPDSECDFASEEEVEAMAFGRDTTPLRVPLHHQFRIIP